MGNKYTESQKRATQKYLKEKTDEVRIRVPKGTKDKWKQYAEENGMSLSGFIIKLVSEHIGG